jgi:hypothetical protein
MAAAQGQPASWPRAHTGTQVSCIPIRCCLVKGPHCFQVTEKARVLVPPSTRDSSWIIQTHTHDAGHWTEVRGLVPPHLEETIVTDLTRPKPVASSLLFCIGSPGLIQRPLVFVPSLFYSWGCPSHPWSAIPILGTSIFTIVSS